MEATFAPDFHEFGRSGRRYTREDLLPTGETDPIDATLHALTITDLSPTIALLTPIRPRPAPPLPLVGSSAGLNADRWRRQDRPLALGSPPLAPKPATSAWATAPPTSANPEPPRRSCTAEPPSARSIGWCQLCCPRSGRTHAAPLALLLQPRRRPDHPHRHPGRRHHPVGRHRRPARLRDLLCARPRDSTRRC